MYFFYVYLVQEVLDVLYQNLIMLIATKKKVGRYVQPTLLDVWYVGTLGTCFLLVICNE